MYDVAKPVRRRHNPSASEVTTIMTLYKLLDCYQTLSLLALIGGGLHVGRPRTTCSG